MPTIQPCHAYSVSLSHPQCEHVMPSMRACHAYSVSLSHPQCELVMPTVRACHTHSASLSHPQGEFVTPTVRASHTLPRILIRVVPRTASAMDFLPFALNGSAVNISSLCLLTSSVPSASLSHGAFSRACRPDNSETQHELVVLTTVKHNASLSS